MSQHQEAARFLVIAGDPLEGFFYVGPFKSYAMAADYSDTQCGDKNCWVSNMIKPEPHEGRMP